MTEVRIETDTVAAVRAEPTPLPPAKPHAHSHGHINSLQSLAMTIVIAVFVITFVVQAFQIPSESMERTLLVGDYLLVDKAHYGTPGHWDWLMPYRHIQRQDIIVFRYPVNPQQHFVKRVIGVPGDRVRLINKHVYVNGVAQDDHYAIFNWADRNKFRDNFPSGDFMEPRIRSAWYLQAKKLVEDGQLIVPQGYYFVLGDNRDDSDDSRYWGLVPAENVVGRPLVIYWSMDRNTAEPDDDPPSDKLSTLTYTVIHSLKGLRWDRMLRIPR